MATMHQIKRIIENFKGLEKRKSDLIDKPGFFSELKNAQIRPSGALSKRKGYQTLASGKGSLGIASYRGSTEHELLLMDEDLSRVTFTDVVFSTNQNKNLNISLLPNDDGYMVFTVSDPNSETVSSQSIILGDGINFTTYNVSINNFVTSLAGLPTELSVSINITGTEQAAFIEPFDVSLINGGSSPITVTSTLATISTVINGTSGYSPFTQYFNSGNINKPITTTMANNVMYFGTGYDEIMKYDGSKIYRAGLPTAPTGTATLIADSAPEAVNVGNTPNEKVFYMLVLVHTDNQGNVIRSNPSEPFTYSTGPSHTHQYVRISLPPIPQSGFDLGNTDYEIYKTNLPIDPDTVDAANFYRLTDPATPTQTTPYNDLSSNQKNAMVGADNVYIDSVPPTSSSNYIFESAPGSVSSVGGSTSYFIDYIHGADDNQIHNESISGNIFINPGDYPEGRHDLPPKGSYVTTHQGSLVISGNRTNPTEVNYSLKEFNTTSGEIGTEYFTPANNVIVDGVNGGPITSIKTLQDSLYIFHEDTISVLTGDITTAGVQALRKDIVSTHGEIGSICHEAVQELESNLVFMANEGIYMINSTSNFPKELSASIKPLVTSKELDKTKAVSFFAPEDDILGFYIPKKDTGSVVYVLDTNSNSWLEWDNVDMLGGLSRHKQNTYFISKEGGTARLQKIKKNGDASDYSDHTSPIDFTAVTAWDSLSRPELFKKFLRLKVFITDSNSDFETNDFKLNLYLRRNFSSIDLGPIELDSGFLGGWGTSEWGITNYGDTSLEGVRTKMFGKAKSMQLKFTNNELNKNILISGMAIEIAAAYTPEIKE